MVDLSAAYDTIWSKGLTVKFLKMIPSRRIGLLMNDMLSNRMFKVYVNELISRWKRLNNGLLQGSVLAPLLFNIYTSDLPITQSMKFI